jgi:hypothetical protein
MIQARWWDGWKGADADADVEISGVYTSQSCSVESGNLSRVGVGLDRTGLDGKLAR